MEKHEIKKKLDYIEGEVKRGNYQVKEMGFYRVVSLVKRNPELIEEFADQIGRIDAAIFRKWAKITMPLNIGHAIEIAATLASITLVFYTAKTPGNIPGIGLVIGAFALMTTLHPLVHYLVGRIFGIRFLYYFPDGPALIEPTLKTDYSTYLRADPLHRAIMHATGPIISTLVFLLFLAMAYLLGAPSWTLIVLGGFLAFNTPFEVLPLLFVKAGLRSFSKSDSYRAYREWKIYKAIKK
jgi:hypothetical protein